ncbi:membrane protein insertion efficiency factor YidD [Magnetovibrio sp.]|uniref:membrane protein insertion efficiency factor YidD n=1 Tax=Magnetovibrio sp. TaxID=2024836 RepID=UPI002F94F8AA
MNPLAFVMRALVLGYKWIISPVLPGSCRFYPTCSSYTLQALETHGALKGGWLGLKRFARCHPWNDGGFDPVPGTDMHTHAHRHDHHGTSGDICCGADPKA